MGLEKLIVVPSKDYLELLRYLYVLTSLIYFPFVGMAISATMLSLAFNYRDSDIPNTTFRRMASDLMAMAVPNRIVPLVFGVLPMVAMCMIYSQWLYQSPAGMLWMLPFGGAIVALSFGPITFYRSVLRLEDPNSPVSRAVGALGLGGLLAGSYIAIMAMVRIQDPERWHLNHGLFRQLFSFNVIWRYDVFLLAGLAITACGLLYFLFSWPGAEKIKDETYVRYVKNFAAGTAIVAVFLIPVVLFFYTVTTPILAMSGPVFAIMCGVTGVLFFCFAILYRNLIGDRPRFGGLAFALFMVVFLLLAVGDQMTLVNATKERTAALVTEWETAKAKRDLERASHMEVKVDVKRGEEVFKTICSTCHRLDEKLVGPPLNTVLPKYPNAEALAKFVSNPVKVNPDYPPMPNPGLSLSDARSVAAYLKGETGGETGETETHQEQN